MSYMSLLCSMAQENYADYLCQKITANFYKISQPEEISDILCCACNKVGQMVYISTHFILHTSPRIFFLEFYVLT